MTTYKEIFGKPIKVVSSDPTDAGAEGQVWYNSTSGTFKTVVSVGAWSSSGNMLENRQNVEGAGTQTAGLAIGGATGPATPAFLATSSEYNGSSWSSPVSKNVAAISEATFGTETAAVAAGGYNNSGATASTVEEYNGSSWTAVTSLPQATRGAMGMGAENSGLVVGGEESSVLTNTQEYNGSGWTAGGAIPTGVYNAAANGTSESNSWFAGGSDGFKNATVLYNGTSWTVSGNLNTARDQAGGSGIQTDALAFGGRTPPNNPSNVTESFNGSTWTTSSATLGTNAKQAAAFGTSTAAVFAGNDPAAAITQEFNFSIYSPIAATWASGGALSTGRESMSSAGTQTAALAVGGRVGPPGASTAVESYNGTAMSGAPSLNTARQYAGGCGTQTAAITYANNPVSGATEEYDGSSWATQPNSMSTARRSFASFGIQTAALAAGGTTGPAVSSLTEEYNGTSWTAGGALSTARQYFAGAGIETSGLVFGGSDNPNSTKYANTEEYGGTSWTAGGALPTGTSGLMGCGATQTAALAFGGYQPSKVATTVEYDGSAWSSKPAMGGATAEGSGAGTNVAGLSIGGSPAETGVEEFTGEIVQLDYKTLTSS